MTVRMNPTEDPASAATPGEVSEQDLDAVAGGVIISTPIRRPSGGGSTAGASASGTPTAGGDLTQQLMEFTGAVVQNALANGKLTIGK